jgi:hypothetical protein
MALLHRLRRPDETFAAAPAADAAVTVREHPPIPFAAALPGPASRPGAVPAAGQAPAAAHRADPGRLELPALPPSVARVAARTRLSAELLAAILEVDARPRATLDDIERADALAQRLLARRADRQRAAASGRPAGPPRPRLAPEIRLAG